MKSILNIFLLASSNIGLWTLHRQAGTLVSCSLHVPSSSHGTCAESTVTERWAMVELTGSCASGHSASQRKSPCLLMALRVWVTPFLPGPLPAVMLSSIFPSPPLPGGCPSQRPSCCCHHRPWLPILAGELVKKTRSEVPLRDFKCYWLSCDVWRLGKPCNHFHFFS